MLSPRLGKNITKKILTLKSHIDFGKKHLGETIEEICDYDPQFVDWCLNSNLFNLDRDAKIYLSARRRENGKPDKNDYKGVIDYGARDSDSFSEIDLWDIEE